MSTPDIRNLASCIDDVRLAARSSDSGPVDPTDYHALRGRLIPAVRALPPLYQETLFVPYVATLDRLGENGFVRILLLDPQRERLAAGSFSSRLSALPHPGRFQSGWDARAPRKTWTLRTETGKLNDPDRGGVSWLSQQSTPSFSTSATPW